jgi:uncharacterized SAM-binding protein YcdF (DUF218 family)
MLSRSVAILNEEPPKSAKRKLLKRSILVFLVAFASYVGWTAWKIWTFQSTYTVKTDAAIVLGASADNGQPSPVFVERINHGIALYKQGLVGKLIFTGGTPADESVTLADVAFRYALAKGTPPADMLLEPYSRITHENLKYAKQIGEANGLRTFLIVSDPLHMRRAMRMATDLHINAKASATPTSHYTTLKSRLQFLSRETRLYLQYVLVTRFIDGRSMEDAKKREEQLNPRPQVITPAHT